MPAEHCTLEPYETLELAGTGEPNEKLFKPFALFTARVFVDCTWIVVDPDADTGESPFNVRDTFAAATLVFTNELVSSGNQ